MTLEKAIIEHAKEQHKRIDSLTNDLIQTLNNFDRLGLNAKARDYWTKCYTTERVKNDTINKHYLDCEAYEVANRRLSQYYNSLKRC